ncbi:MAG: hypothetical protein ACE5HE_02890 [Phycisphaerae bacterium]
MNADPRSLHKVPERPAEPAQYAEALRLWWVVLPPLAALVCLASITAIVSPEFVAHALFASVLPANTDLVHGRVLVRNLAVAGLVVGAMFLVWRLTLGRNRPGALAGWFVLASIVLYLAGSVSLWWYVNDDAAITFTFARNLAGGYGLVFNRAEAPIEGYSNPLWLLLLAGGRICGMDIVWTAKVGGLVLGAASIMLMGVVVLREHPLSWLALPIAATTASFIIWNNSGLENALHGMLLIAVAMLLRKPLRMRSRRLAALVSLLVLLVLARPEGVLFAAFAGLYVAITALRAKGPFLPALAVWGVPAVAFACLTGFRYWYFGDLLPNTFYAKASQTNPLRLFNPFSGGWSYVHGSAEACGWIVAMVPVLILFDRRRPAPSFLPAALTLVGAQVFFIVSVGGDWMAESRFISPVVPIVSIIIALGLARLWDLLRRACAWNKAGFVICLAVAASIVGPQARRLILFEHHPTTPMDTVARIGRYFVDLAARGGIEDPTLLHHDAGGTTYVANIRLIDLGGLCDRTVAKHWHEPEIIRHYLFEQRRPTFIYSSATFADRIGLQDFPEFHSDYVALPPATDEALKGDVRRVRRDAYDRIFARHK